MQDNNVEKFAAVFDKINDYILKAIRGIFIFTFKELPKEFWEWLTSVSPLMIRMTKFMVLILIWSMIVAGPVGFLRYYYKIHGDANTKLWYSIPIYVWTLLSLGGSVWGIIRLGRESKVIQKIITKIREKKIIWKLLKPFVRDIKSEITM